MAREGERPSVGSWPLSSCVGGGGKSLLGANSTSVPTSRTSTSSLIVEMVWHSFTDPFDGAMMLG